VKYANSITLPVRIAGYVKSVMSVRKRRRQRMNKEILIEALEIAKNNFDYDGEYDKAGQVLAYLQELEGENE
jgi:hypothetical protein